MKRFLLVVMLFASAASLYAADLKVTGQMDVRGVMNGYDSDATGYEAYSENFFDYDLTIDAAFVANENATVFTKFALDKKVDGLGETAMSNDSEVAATDGEQFVAIERAYINYKFMPALQINAGLMAGGQWASAFKNEETNIMRVQVIGALSQDMIFIATYEKNNENGLPAADKAEDFEATSYYLAAKLKFGAIEVLPLFKYVSDGYGTSGMWAMQEKTMTTISPSVGINGTFGQIGLESEFVYAMVDMDGALYLAGPLAGTKVDDKSMYGAYINVFFKLAETTKVGAAAVYGSADEKDGVFTWGEDFDFTLILDDVQDAGDGSQGMGFKVYGAAEVMPKLTLGGCGAYYMPTDDKVNGDYSAWEIDADATYALDANVDFTLALGYASKTVTAATDVTTTQYQVYTKLSCKF